MTEEQKRNHARVLNVNRRHLSKEQRNEVISAMKSDGMSNRQIAETMNVNEITVRRTLEGATIVAPDFVTGRDGKIYPARPTHKPEPPPTMFDPGGSAALELRQIRYMGARVIRYFVMGGPGIIQYFIAVALAPRSSLVYYYL